MRPNHSLVMLAMMLSAVGQHTPVAHTTAAKTPRRFTEERKAAAEAKRARKQAKRATAHHGGSRG